MPHGREYIGPETRLESLRRRMRRSGPHAIRAATQRHPWTSGIDMLPVIVRFLHSHPGRHPVATRGPPTVLRSVTDGPESQSKASVDPGSG